MPLGAAVLARKIELLGAHFASQRSKDWFDAETFTGLARLRGMECRAPERYAEAFVLRKATLSQREPARRPVFLRAPGAPDQMRSPRAIPSG
jgi:hypothetical protein